MKEKIKEILGGLFMIAAGVVSWLIADEYVLMLFGFVEVDFRIFGAIIAAIGLFVLVAALLPKKGRKKPESAKPQSGSSMEDVVNTYFSDAFTPQAAPAVKMPDVNVQMTVLQARDAGTPEAFRKAIAALEPCQEADPENGEVVSGMLACYDGLLRTKGDRSFEDYQQRFYAAVRAIYLEEHSGKKPTSRRFWAIHCAVHGGIAAASAKNLDQLEDASYMLERAAQMKSELDREVDRQYMETAVPCVRCWVAYWIARITATDKPDYERSIDALQLAATLFPREGDIRVCDMNPHLKENTKTMLTWNNLDALRRHLIKVAGE